MFDIGFGELTLLALIGLVVLGPERLPRVARTLGLWVARARNYLGMLSQELESEIRDDELHKQLQESRREIESLTRQANTRAVDNPDDGGDAPTHHE